MSDNLLPNQLPDSSSNTLLPSEGASDLETGDLENSHRQAQSPWLAVAPLVAWWWLVLALATALILGFGFLRVIALFARPLGILILGVAIATSLAPIASFLSNRMPRTLAVILIYLMLVLTVGGIGWLALPAFVNQLQDFADYVPQLVRQVQSLVSGRVAADASRLIQNLASMSSGLSLDLIALPVTLIGTLLETFLVIFISLYALIVAPDVRRFILSLVPQQRRAQTTQLLGDMYKAMGGYVRGVMLSGAIVGVFTYIGLLLLGVQYPLLLAIFAAAMELFPILGTLISTVTIVLVALFQSPQLALFTLIFMLVLQQLEGNVIFPNMMSRQTHISPLLGLVAFFAGGVVGGLLGALVAIPLAAALRVLVVELVAPMVRRWTGASASPEPDAEHEATRATK